MEKTKLTVRIPRDVLEGAKRYARENRTTLTRLVSEYLRQLTAQSDPLPYQPTSLCHFSYARWYRRTRSELGELSDARR